MNFITQPNLQSFIRLQRHQPSSWERVLSRVESPEEEAARADALQEEGGSTKEWKELLKIVEPSWLWARFGDQAKHHRAHQLRRRWKLDKFVADGIWVDNLPKARKSKSVTLVLGNIASSNESSGVAVPKAAAVATLERTGWLRYAEFAEELSQQIHQPNAQSDQRDEISESTRRWAAEVLQWHYARQAASGRAHHEARSDQRDSNNFQNSAVRSGHARPGAQVTFNYFTWPSTNFRITFAFFRNQLAKLNSAIKLTSQVKPFNFHESSSTKRCMSRSFSSPHLKLSDDSELDDDFHFKANPFPKNLFCNYMHFKLWEDNYFRWRLDRWEVL